MVERLTSKSDDTERRQKLHTAWQRLRRLFKLKAKIVKAIAKELKTIRKYS